MKARAGFVMFVLALTYGCNDSDRVNLATYCSDNLVLIFVDIEDPDGGEIECVPPPVATQHRTDEDARATKQAKIDEYNPYRPYATEEAKRDEMFRREQEEQRKEAIRSCILAGNHPELCALDPGDPYGTGEQR